MNGPTRTEYTNSCSHGDKDDDHRDEDDDDDEEEEETISTTKATEILRIIVMNSDSGKPIYSCKIFDNDTTGTTEEEEDDDDDSSTTTTTICSIIHSLQTSSQYNTSTIGHLGHLHSIATTPSHPHHHYGTEENSTSATTNIVFMTTMTTPKVTPTSTSTDPQQHHQQPNGLTLIAITTGSTSNSTLNNKTNDELYIRIRLEYFYTQFIMTMTDQNLNNYHHHRMLLSLEQQQGLLHPASTLTSGIYPVTILEHNNKTTTSSQSPPLRNQISKRIQQQIQYVCCTSPSPSTTPMSANTTTTTIIAAFVLYNFQHYVTIVVPPFTNQPLSSSDFAVLPLFLQRQFIVAATVSSQSPSQPQSVASPPLHDQQSPPSSSASEIWVPICLPRLYSSGYVHCYACDCSTGSSMNNTTDINDATTSTNPQAHHKFTIGIISTTGTSSELQLLRTIGQGIRKQLVSVLPSPHPPSTTTTAAATTTTTTTFNSDIATKNSNSNSIANVDDEDEDDADYELITSFDAAAAVTATTTTGDDIESKHHDCINNNKDDDHQHHRNSNDSLLSRLITVMNTTTIVSNQNWIRERYLKNTTNTTNSGTTSAATIKHFVFRVDIPIINTSCNNDKNRHHHTTASRRNSSKNNNRQHHLIQCISSCCCRCARNDITRPYHRHKNHRRWSMYHKLQSRLRRSACESTTSHVLPLTTVKERNANTNHHLPTIDLDCPMIVSSESSSSRMQDGVTYITENGITYFAMNGNGFELYFCAEHPKITKDGTTVIISSIAQIAKLGANLVRQLLDDVDILFISQPLTIG